MMKTRFKPEDFTYYIEPKLKRKLDNLIELLEKRDAWVLLLGPEGSGKTNTAAYIMFYVACHTGRPFYRDTRQFYFDTDDLVNFAKDNQDQIINWDEAALGGLSTEWWSNSQRNLVKFGLTGRKKHHFFVLCMPHFNKLTEYLRQDRTHNAIYMRVNSKQAATGKYMYITKRGKTKLNRFWLKKHVLPYQKCMKSCGGHGGSIPFMFNDVCDEDAYDSKKDEAISSIGVKNPSRQSQNLAELKAKIGILIKDKRFGLKQKETAKVLGVNVNTIENWVAEGKSLGKSP